MATPLLLHLFLSLLLPSLSFSQQLPPAQRDALLRLPRLLELPSTIRYWNDWTPFCYLPKTPSLSISCSNDGITDLSVVGDKPKIPGGHRDVLSANFSADSLFTTLSSIPTLRSLSLVSLGMWGELSPKLDRLKDLQVLNLSGNYFYGEIPKEISTMASLVTLNLGGNLLKGVVPNLAGLLALEELDLGRNKLGPDFPVVGKSVVALVLRNNSFRANIPPGVRDLVKLERLDLASNRLFGPIPEFLFSLPSVRYLDLAGNSLSGAIPATTPCGGALEFVDLSRNRLVGSLPACIRSNTSRTSVMYSWNCLTAVDSRYQHPKSFCNVQPFAAIVPRSKANGSGGGGGDSGGGSKSKLGLLLGIAGGIAGGVVLIALMLLVVFKKAKAKDRGAVLLPKSAPKYASAAKVPPPDLPVDARHISPEVRLGMLDLKPYRVYNMDEIREMTDNFDLSNLVQENSQDQIFRGCLQDGSTVIIRCLKVKQKHSPQTLHQYMDTISKLRHHHLVTILGHCIDSFQESLCPTVYLIYEYISNGTLRSHLTEWRKREMLKWPQRVAAVIGVAKGIQFLHTVTTPGIFRNDLKMENILLDKTLAAKISNYNLPILAKNKNNKVGGDGPFSIIEIKDVGSMELGDKEDVYQLGLILLEVITGKPAVTQSELEALKDQLQSILSESSPRRLQGLTDHAIHGTFAFDSLKTAVEIALNCLSIDPSKRPSIDDILWNLQYSIQIQDACASAESLNAQP